MIPFIIQYWPYGLASIVITAALHYLIMALRGHVRPSLRVGEKWHYHAGGGIAVWLVLAVLALLTLSFHMGALRDHKHIKPAARYLAAGSVAPSTLDYGSYMPPVLNQGNTNACGAFAVTEALYAEYRMRGETPPDWFSPWYTYYWTGVGGGYTAFDQDAGSVINHGLAYYNSEPSYSDATWSSYEVPNTQHASWRVVYDNYSGANALTAIKGALDLGYPVVILASVNDGMWYLPASADSTDNSGASHGTHFMVVQGYSGSWLHVRNSWGTGYGSDGGTFWLTGTLSIIAAYVIAPGASEVWPTIHHAPKPVPTATRRPTAPPRPTATPRPRPTATPKPKHTKTRRLKHPQDRRGAREFYVTREMAARAKPLLKAVKLFNVMPRWTVTVQPQRQTTHWEYACLLRKRQPRCGYLLKDHLRR